MARTTLEPGTTAYMAIFTGAPVQDLDSEVAATSPIELSPAMFKGADFVTICVSNATISEPLTWQLVFRDGRNDVDTPVSGYVIAAVGGVSSDVPGTRRKDPDNAGDAYLHNPLQFDIRGLPILKSTRAYLVALTTPTGNAYLESIWPVKDKPI